METGKYGRALLVSVDAKGYGEGTDKRHEAIQAGLVEVYGRAAKLAGLCRDGWYRQAAGDGELALLPPSESEPRVVDQLIRALDGELTEHNRALRPEERLRLRVAVHFGVAYPAANGLAGQGVVEVSRLVDCEPIKKVLIAKDQADVALILSDRVYSETILQGHTTHKPGEFRKVRVREKSFQGDAWIWVPGVDIGDVSFPDMPEPDTDDGGHRFPASVQKATVINNMHGPVNAHGAIFGIGGDRAVDR